MQFADLKNDYIFRKIFGTHPEILRGLLNDLLERTGDQTIVSIEYLPSELMPLVQGAKLSVLDVRCKDQRGSIFVVEMQLIHMAGFIERVVYNACKTYVNQLKAGELYTKLVDVVAISICDFELWPDAVQDAKNEPRTPMLSHFMTVEKTNGAQKLAQVQYAFLELPKVPKEKPAGGAALWAWLFVNAPKLQAVPESLPVGPMREAMELANQSSMNELEWDAYRKAMDEIWQARQYGEDKWKEGLAEGHIAGHQAGILDGKRETLLKLLKRAGVIVNDGDVARTQTCNDSAILDGWLDNVIGAKSIAEVFASAPENLAAS